MGNIARDLESETRCVCVCVHIARLASCHNVNERTSKGGRPVLVIVISINIIIMLTTGLQFTD
jgi:hypothetical protein